MFHVEQIGVQCTPLLILSAVRMILKDGANQGAFVPLGTNGVRVRTADDIKSLRGNIAHLFHLGQMGGAVHPF